MDSTEQWKQEIEYHGDKAAILPIGCLPKLKKDAEDWERCGLTDAPCRLNAFSQEVTRTYYNFNPPPTGFQIRSILVVASPSPLVKVTFNWKGELISLFLPPAYRDRNTKPREIEEYLNNRMEASGYHVRLTEDLPLKMLAVRSGLCVCGRNSVCYREDMGSFLKLSAFYSDLPSENENWHTFRQMDSCRTCKACASLCPTEAITAGSFLVDAGRRLTHFNEQAGADFPEWIGPFSHTCVCGCMKCQLSCPQNRPYVNAFIEPAEFSEEETRLLAEGKSVQCFSETLTNKLEVLDMIPCLAVLPRNLKALLNASNASNASPEKLCKI